MGKKQHQQDKMYLTSTEWKNYYGGKKPDRPGNESSEFKRLPFSCCALTFQPFKHPYCSREGGHIFDLENIMPFIKKYGKNPITGDKLDAKSLVKLVFHKNAKDQFHCPITFKVFNENTHIMAIAKTGNVFCSEAIETLNLKTNHLKDLLTDEPFIRKDIISLQDPNNISKFNINDFYYVKEKLKWGKDDDDARRDPNYVLKSINSEAKDALEELNKTYVAPSTSQSSTNYLLAAQGPKADSVNAASYSTGRVAASFTSTVMEIVTTQEPAIIEENTVRWERMKKLGKKGYVCLVTNLGRLNIELFCDQVPRVCENFIKLCDNKYYKDTTFHRSVRNFMIQGGDPTGTGTGGQSIWDKPFEDEFKPNLSHNGRGILSMANSGPDTNKSQFFITYRSCPHLDKVHSVFGKVVGGIDTLNKMEAIETDKKERPKVSIKIEDCIVFVDPYIEVDEKIKSERAQAIEDKTPKKPEEKPVDVMELKPVRQGIGKYISVDLLEKKHKLANAEDEDDKVELTAKKLKAASSKTSSSSYGNFSDW